MNRFFGHAAALIPLVWFAGFSIWSLNSYPIPWPDEPHFAQPAYRLITNGELSCPLILGQENRVFWVPPGYFAPLGLFFSIAGFGLEQQRIFSILCGCGVLLLTYMLALRVSRHRTIAFLSSLFLAFDPFFLRYAKLGRMDGLTLFLLLLGILILLTALEKKSFSLHVVAGILFGYASSVHPMATILLLVSLTWAVLWKRGELTRKFLFALLLPTILSYMVWLIYGLSDFQNFLSQTGFQWHQKSDRSLAYCLETLIADYRTIPMIGIAYCFGLGFLLVPRNRIGISETTKLLLLSASISFIVAVLTTEAPHILYALPFLCIVLAMACNILFGRTGILKYARVLTVVLFVGNGLAHAAYFGWKYRIDRPEATSCAQLSRLIGIDQHSNNILLLDGYPELFWEIHRQSPDIRIIEPPFFSPDLQRKALRLADTIVLVRGFHVVADSVEMARKVYTYEDAARSVDKELQFVAAVGTTDDWMFSARVYRVVPARTTQ